MVPWEKSRDGVSKLWAGSGRVEWAKKEVTAGIKFYYHFLKRKSLPVVMMHYYFPLEMLAVQFIAHETSFSGPNYVESRNLIIILWMIVRYVES